MKVMDTCIWHAQAETWILVIFETLIIKRIKKQTAFVIKHHESFTYRGNYFGPRIAFKWKFW